MVSQFFWQPRALWKVTSITLYTTNWICKICILLETSNFPRIFFSTSPEKPGPKLTAVNTGNSFLWFYMFKTKIRKRFAFSWLFAKGIIKNRAENMWKRKKIKQDGLAFIWCYSRTNLHSYTAINTESNAKVNKRMLCSSREQNFSHNFYSQVKKWP